MHSANHQGSGSTIIVRDPTTGMAINLTFAPGQMKKMVQVEMNGKTYAVQAELRQRPDAPGNGEDLAFGLIANAAIFDMGDGVETKARKPAPHPATVLASKDETLAAKEALRLKRAEDEERAERGEEKPNYQMTDAELAATHKALDAAKRPKDSFDKPGLPSVEDGEIDPSVVDQFVMSPEEVAEMKEAAKPKGEAEVSDEVELVEEVAEEVSVETSTTPAEGSSGNRRNRRNR